jgi:hypothetical protein
MFVGAIAGIVLALGVFAAVAWQRMDQFGSRFSAGRSNSPSAIVSAPESSVAKTSAETDAQPVYRYSVIPGGVRTPEELLAAMANDSVVAGHYAGIDKTKLTSGRLNEPLRAHVSYRIGDRVYWTKRKVTLQAGEQVVTDGQTLVRARCGNNVSVDPLLPTLDNEPKPEAFDAIVPPEAANTLVQLDPAHSYFTPNDLKTPQAGSGRAPFGGSSIGGIGGPIPAGNSGTSGASPNTQSGDAPPNGVPPGGNPPGDPPGNPPCVPPGANISAQGLSSAVSPDCIGGNPPGGNPPGGDPPGGDPPGGNPKGDPPNDFPPNDVPNAPTAVPEPGTLLLVGAGAAALLAHRIRKQKRA